MASTLSTTQLRHPLASTKRLLEFVDDRKVKIVEPFEVLAKYDTEYAIAKGTYGFVARVRDKERAAEFLRVHDDYDQAAYDKATLVAVKKGSHLFEHGMPRVWLCAIREIQLLLSFNHPNVMCATDLFIPLGEVKDLRLDLIRQRQRDFEEVYIVMPFMNYSLRDLLDDPENNFLVSAEDPISQVVSEWHPLENGLRRHLMFHISCGLGYIHQCGVMHRDLKPENILLTQDEAWPKICDFGQGREIARDQCLTTTKTDNCTQWYASPETLTFEHGGESQINRSTFHSADAWSLGCIAAELLLGRPLFATTSTGGEAQLKTIMSVLGRVTEDTCVSLGGSRNEEDQTHLKKLMVNAVQDTVPSESILSTMLRAAYVRLGEDVDDDEVSLIEGLLHYDPAKRWTCQQVLESPYFTKAEYEPVVGGVVQEIKLVSKEDVDTAQSGREYLWKLFVEKHPAVTQLLNVLTDKS